jgi:DNA polymerase-1
VLEKELEKLQSKIFERNHGVEFNINSHAKVSRILFGPRGGSTEKAVLEAKAAGGDRMASLILEYRSVKQQISRLKRKRENVRDGSQVSSPSAVARADNKQDYSADPLMLVDASSYIFRAYYSMPPIHRAVDGMPTGAVLGFCNMLNKLALNKMLQGETPRLVLVFDAKGKTFRHELYREYKSHRPEAPVDLIPQFALVRHAARAYGICQIEAPTFEADDVIATLSRMARDEGVDVNIFSGDKDLMQLVSDRGAVPGVQMIDPATMSRYTYDTVMEKWGVPPSQLGDVLALAGDAADNVPGAFTASGCARWLSAINLCHLLNVLLYFTFNARRSWNRSQNRGSADARVRDARELARERGQHQAASSPVQAGRVPRSGATVTGSRGAPG